MTRKELRDWFERGRRSMKRIRHIERTVERLYDGAVSITPNYDGLAVDGTKDPHKFDSYAVLLDDYEREKAEHMKVLEEIRAVTRQIPDDRYKVILEMRYLLCMTWEQIEEETHYSEHCFYLHRQALKAAEEFINA